MLSKFLSISLKHNSNTTNKIISFLLKNHLIFWILDRFKRNHISLPYKVGRFYIKINLLDYSNLLILYGTHLSGLKVSGSGKYFGSLWRAKTGMLINMPFLSWMCVSPRVQSFSTRLSLLEIKTIAEYIEEHELSSDVISKTMVN